MRQEPYNGWTNYETWQAALWIGNDEGLYRTVRDMLPDPDGDADGSVYAPDTLRDLESSIRDLIEHELIGDDSPASLSMDILAAWMREVDWREVTLAQLDQ